MSNRTKEINRLNNIITKFHNQIQNPVTEKQQDENFAALQDFTKEATAGKIIPVGYFPNNHWVINKEYINDKY